LVAKSDRWWFSPGYFITYSLVFGLAYSLPDLVLVHRVLPRHLLGAIIAAALMALLPTRRLVAAFDGWLKARLEKTGRSE
jgi:hypothetical protein